MEARDIIDSLKNLNDRELADIRSAIFDTFEARNQNFMRNFRRGLILREKGLTPGVVVHAIVEDFGDYVLEDYDCGVELIKICQFGEESLFVQDSTEVIDTVRNSYEIVGSIDMHSVSNKRSELEKQLANYIFENMKKEEE